MSDHTTDTEREIIFKELRRKIGDKGLAPNDKPRLRALLEELERARLKGELTGFESSQLPWLRNIAKQMS